MRLDDAAAWLYAVVVISAVGSAISGLEWLYLSKHFKGTGVYSWSVSRIARPDLDNWGGKRLAGLALDSPWILGIPALQTALSILILVSRRYPAALAAECLGIVCCLALQTWRNGLGITGADKMLKITFLCAGVAFAVNDVMVLRTALFFVAGQVLLAYTTAGWSRLRVPGWRDGTLLLHILRQHTYGNRWIWSLGRSSSVFRVGMCASIQIFECSAPLALILPTNLLFCYLGAGIAFHLGNAIVMGLNGFFWAFTATYPAVVFSSIFIHERFLAR